MLNDYEVIVYDCEVFAHDWLFVFKDRATGEYSSFWNDPEALEAFMGSHEDSLFVGFNSSHYDQYILKAILAGCDPEQVKEVNDWIIGTDSQPWEHPYLKGFFYSFHDVDLMKDTQMGTSLKSIEGHAGMSVEESDVPFDIDRALTTEERAEVERYCRHDVDATEQLLGMRTAYLETKERLGERAGLEPARAMALTNAKLTAAVLGAERVEHDDERGYVYPDNLLREFIPSEVIEFFDRIGDADVSDEELWKSKLELEVGGCPVTLGFGGIHGALPKWRGKSDSSHRLVNADVASYYPSLMVRNGYTSRNMPHPDVFKGIYEERLAAKAAGDKATANALKLIVNTTYGATLNQYNDLCDPLMARSVCVSGQLYLLELACHLVRDVEGLVLVQLNTDGILVMLPTSGDAIGTFERIVGEWQERTGFGLEFDDIERIWQKDVNNYAMRLVGGKEKVKGVYLVRGASAVGAFSINNNATVVAEALRRYLLDGIPVRETVKACDDPAAFQLIAKAGHKYSRVYQKVLSGATEGGEPAWEDVPVQKCNRVFASLDGRLGRLYKVKAADGSVAKVESLPEHCLIRNDGNPPIEDIDKTWYIALAEKRAQDFQEERNMTEEKPKTAPKRTTAAKKAAAPDYSGMNVYQKLAIARKMFLESGVKKSGVNDHAEYDYFELEDIVPAQTRIFDEVGLIELFAYVGPKPMAVKRGDTYDFIMSEPVAIASVVNVDNPAQVIEFRLKWSEVPPIISNKGKEVNTPIQRTGGEQTYMRRYLKMQVLDIVESDAVDSQDFEASAENAAKAETAAKKAPSASKKPAAKAPAPKKPATASQRKAVASEIANADGAATPLQLRQLKSTIKKLKDQYGQDHPEVAQFTTELGVSTDKFAHSAKDPDAPFTKAECEAAIQKLGKLREQFETGE